MITYIEKLLNGQPVEWKTLGEVAEIEKGKQLNKERLTATGLYPAYNGGVSYSGFTDRYSHTENKTIISQGGASAGFVNFIETRFYANAHCYVVLPNEELVHRRFVYHILKRQQPQLKGKQFGAGIPALKTKDLLTLPIPIPPLSVQEEIVRILDKFTELEAVLEAELEVRKQQYEYYRNSLLSFANDLEGGLWKPLGEACEVIGGFAFKSSLFKEEGMPIVRIGNITASNHINMDDSKCFNPEDYAGINFQSYLTQAGDILVAMSGATTGKIGYYTGEEVSYINQRVSKLSPKSEILNNRFLYHYLLGKSDYLYHLAGGGAQPNLSAKDLRTRLLIPIPPLAEQERIARILDKFDTLTNSLTEGLPQEIELRRKQYEYYREQLLSFPA